MTRPCILAPPITTDRSRAARASPLALALALAALPSDARAEPDEERVAITHACRIGPASVRARASLLRGDALVDAASVLPNPTLVGGHHRSFTGPEDSETLVGISVPLGIGGRRFVLEDAAEERRTAAVADGDEVLLAHALELSEAIARARAELARADAIGRQHDKLVRLASTIAGLEKGGESSEYEKLRHGIEMRVHAERVGLARSRAASARVRLGAYGDRPVDVARIDLERLGRGAPATPQPSTHPRIRGLDATIRATALEEEAAERRWVPELDLFVGYRAVTALASETGHGLSISLEVPLTFFDHGQGEAALSRAARADAEAERRAFEQAQRAESDAAAASLVLLDELSSPEEGAANAETLETHAVALYLAGEGTLTELLAAHQTNEASELSAIELAEARALARIQGMRAAGSLFDAELDRVCRVGRGPR